VKAAGRDMAGITKFDAFHLQQGPLHRESPLEAAQVSIGADCPVAGYDDGKGIRCQGGSDGTGAIGIIEVFCDEAVCADRASRDGVLGTQYSLLKGRTKVKPDYIEGEPDVLSRHEGFNLIRKDVYLPT
jgi:hypothetical protein